MKRTLKYIFILIIVIITGLFCYLKLALPNVGEPEELNVKITPERVERGRYLANHVSVCMDCHSTRDWSLFSGPLVKGTLGKGGEVFDRKFGFPGRFFSANLTPEGIGSWTDGELLRAIASGVNKNNKALFPVMPHANYGKMEKEDLLSIIAYLRTLNPIKNAVPAAEVDFPMSLIINTIPKKAEYAAPQNRDNELAYGAYLFNAAACGDCHTMKDKGQPVAGMELAGGFEFRMPGGVVRSANITPDRETGIGSWTREGFIRRFRQHADANHAPAAAMSFNTPMPWTMYSGMSEKDLGAMFEFLKRVKPVSNSVERFTR